MSVTFCVTLILFGPIEMKFYILNAMVTGTHVFYKVMQTFGLYKIHCPHQAIQRGKTMNKYLEIEFM